MLEVANIEVVYNGVMLVLKGVSLRVPEGEVVALLGPNGAGKTTLLRALTGLLDIHDGEITKGSATWKGHDLGAMSASDIVSAGIAQVMEGRRILPELTVEENLRAGAFIRSDGEISDDVDRFCQRFPVLGERRDRTAGYLSGGEQQMLAIARALMARPRLLLLDEPSLGLAPQIVENVASLIREINEDGVSILLVEQNARVALDLASHGYIMENGKIVLDGTTEELKSDRDVREFYLGGGEDDERTSYRDVKLYRRRKRWLS
jgi:branched-chain amino acid transport system ATP-binding protein